MSVVQRRELILKLLEFHKKTLIFSVPFDIKIKILPFVLHFIFHFKIRYTFFDDPVFNGKMRGASN